MGINRKVIVRLTETPAYSEVFKRKVVREYESGRLSKNELKRKYGIGGNATVLKWCKKYGKLDYNTCQTFFSVKDLEQQQQRIRELEKKLKEAEFKLMVYDKLIEVTNRQLDIDVIKKIEAKLSESLQQLPKGK
jgi:transposase-like protein